MDYYSKIQKTINYIEENITKFINLTDLSDLAGFSLYHFYRIFQAMVGYSVKEYIRKRRLTLGAYQLLYSDSSILDVALDHQYNTHESFSRAFKKEFCINPKEFREKGKLFNLFGKEDLIKYKKNKDKLEIEPEIVIYDEFCIIGVELKTTIINDENFKVIPEFWEKYHQFKCAANIPNKSKIRKSYGLCINYDNDMGNFSYIIGEEVTTLDIVPEGYVGITVPASKYAVFNVKGIIPDAIQKTAKMIYGVWFPQSGQERGETAEFELYDARIKNNPPEVDIYVPLK